MKKIAALSLGILLFSAAPPASAAVLMAEEELTIVIPLEDDTYAAGGIVNIQETIEGDLFLAGGEVTMKGDVEQDLILVGGEITLGGSIGDDVRIGGGQITISSTIEDDLIVFGGEITITENANILGDVRIYGGDIVIDGTIEGDLQVRGGSLKVSGTIGGDADMRADTLRFSGNVDGNAIVASKDLNISNTAYFQQDVHYWQPEGLYYFAGATVQGSTEYDESLAFQPFDDVKQTALDVFRTGLIAIAGYGLLSASFFILLMILATRNYFVDGAKRLQKAPGMSLWYGFLYLLVTPFIALVFCITIIGIPIGLFIGVLYLFSIYFAYALTGILLAKWVQVKYQKKWSTLIFFLASVGMYVLLRIVTLIPVVGTLAVLILTLMMFGALMHTEYHKYLKVR
jgi:cytoskeletal protein CcmA (bactofilin family)